MFGNADRPLCATPNIQTISGIARASKHWPCFNRINHHATIHNINVNAICPGLVQTDFAKALWDNPEILKASTTGSCLKRIGQPDEIAGMAVFLASKAGAFTTGQSIVIDGGATIV